MVNQTHDVTVTLPMAAVKDMLSLFSALVVRSHGLLGPGIERPLSATERSDLEMLVRCTESERILSMSLEPLL